MYIKLKELKNPFSHRNEKGTKRQISIIAIVVYARLSVQNSLRLGEIFIITFNYKISLILSLIFVKELIKSDLSN